MEREIGNYKKKMRARINADANAMNVLESITRFKFIETTKMIDFSALYNRNETTNKQDFEYHPGSDPEDSQAFPQLWAPFAKKEIKLSTINVDYVIEGLVPANKFLAALAAYKRRFLGIARNRPVHLNMNQCIKPAAKLWSDSHVYASTMFKPKQSTGSNKRGGEYVMFESNVKKR